MAGFKIENLQALRGVAVLLVLLSHVSDMGKKYGVEGGVLPNFENEGSGGIYLFFVISGFIMVTISRELHQVPGAFGAFLYRRAARIYPLYWLISFVIVAVWLVRPGWVNSSMGGNIDLVSSFLLLPQNWLPLLGQGWTLVHEVYFYLVFAFALFLPRRFLPFFLSAWAMVVLLVVVLVPDLPVTGAPAAGLVFNALTLQFLAGAASALWVARTSLWAGAFCFLAGSLALAVFLASPPSESPLSWQVMVRTLPVLAIVHGAVVLERAGVLLPRFLRSIGDVSYSIYLSHILVISALGRAWASLGSSAHWTNWMLIGLMIGGAIFCGYVCYFVVERPLLRLAHGRRTGSAGVAALSFR